MDDDLVARLSELDKQRLQRVLESVAAAKGGEIAALLAPIGANEPLRALQAAHDALVAWAGQEQGPYARKEKRLYAIEVDDISRRVAADIAVPRDTGGSD